MRLTHSIGASVVVSAITALPAAAQGLCGAPGADLAISHIDGVRNYSPSEGMDSVVLATRQTNVGGVAIVADLVTAQHPVMAENIYCHSLVNGVSRFEQLGMGWCFHAGIPLNMGGYCTCQGGSNSTIGPGCSDPHSATLMGTASMLGPRWEVNASSGAAAHPHATPVGPHGGRVTVLLSDVDPAANIDASFFGEVLVVHVDEDAANTWNNATWRPVSVAYLNSSATFALAGASHPGEAALLAWKTLVPGVVEAVVDVPDDGRFLLAARALRIGGNQWNYEYAVFNLNSHRAARAFSLECPDAIQIGEHGFHDVDYHSGDGPGGVSIAGTDWVFDGSADAARWETDAFEMNPTANALRWGTLYNFRVSCNAVPLMGTAALELFRPGGPAAIDIVITVPGGPSCLGDHDGDGSRAVSDIFAFLSDWFSGSTAGDADGDDATTVPDIFRFLASWFPGC